MGHGSWIGTLFLAVAIGGPLLLWLAGYITQPDPAPRDAERWDWGLTFRSALIYALAFNLVFFIQELFLVLPKAMVPSLRPTLYHNNHVWEGDDPIALLFQGTGALAILVAGLAFAGLARSGAGRSANARLFLVWMAYNGLFQALPQVVVGAFVPENDVGRAMDYLELGPAAKAAAALIALAAIVWAGLAMIRPLLALAESEAWIETPSARRRFIFRVATLPALIAIALILPFRVPRELIEVLLPPIAVAIVGLGWIQGGAWRETRVEASGRPLGGSVVAPLAALAVLFAVFQLILRPGIPFY